MKPLNNRHQRILQSIVDGHDLDRISNDLEISPKTINNQLTEIYRSFGVSNLTQAVVAALRNNYVDLRHPEPILKLEIPSIYSRLGLHSENPYFVVRNCAPIIQAMGDSEPFCVGLLRGCIQRHDDVGVLIKSTSKKAWDRLSHELHTPIRYVEVIKGLLCVDGQKVESFSRYRNTPCLFVAEPGIDVTELEATVLSTFRIVINAYRPFPPEQLLARARGHNGWLPLPVRYIFTGAETDGIVPSIVVTVVGDALHIDERYPLFRPAAMSPALPSSSTSSNIEPRVDA
jgi:DNA-binding CsgD family transcriptional regulator